MISKDLIIKELKVPDFLCVPVGKSLIQWLGSAAIQSIGITYENYLNWEFGLRYAFIYTICCKEDHDVPDSFIITVFQKEKAASIVRILFSGLTYPPWRRGDGSDCEFETYDEQASFRKEKTELRLAKLRRILGTLSPKDLSKLWRRMRDYEPEKFLTYCPKEFLLLIMGDYVSETNKSLIEKRLKGD